MSPITRGRRNEKDEQKVNKQYKNNCKMQRDSKATIKYAISFY